MIDSKAGVTREGGEETDLQSKLVMSLKRMERPSHMDVCGSVSHVHSCVSGHLCWSFFFYACRNCCSLMAPTHSKYVGTICSELQAFFYLKDKCRVQYVHVHVHVSQKGLWTFWKSPSHFYPTDIGLTDKLVSEAVKRQKMVVMGKTQATPQVTSQARLETGTKEV